jgi:hypothetical protein
MEAGHEGKIEGYRALVEALRDQVRYCKEYLDTRREVLKEHRRLPAGLIERLPELEASVESPASSQSREEPAQEHAETTLTPSLQRAVKLLGTALSASPGGEGCWVGEVPTSPIPGCSVARPLQSPAYLFGEANIHNFVSPDEICCANVGKVKG